MDVFHLEWVEPAKNRFRYYGVSVERNLFGDRSVIVRWGRIGRAGRQRVAASGDAGAMDIRARRLVRDKLRRGYVET